MVIEIRITFLDSVSVDALHLTSKGHGHGGENRENAEIIFDRDSTVSGLIYSR